MNVWNETTDPTRKRDDVVVLFLFIQRFQNLRWVLKKTTMITVAPEFEVVLLGIMEVEIRRRANPINAFDVVYDGSRTIVKMKLRKKPVHIEMCLQVVTAKVANHRRKMEIVMEA